MTRLVGCHEDLVFGFCLKMLGHRQDAEDATQETFSRFFKYFDRWDGARPVEPWLIKIAGNRCRTLISRRPQLDQLSPSCDPANDDDTTKRAADQLREEISLILLQLPTKHRLAFKLFHDRELSYEQIAIRLKCPIGTVKTWVHRARGELMEQLRDRGVLVENHYRRGASHSASRKMEDR